MYLPYYGVYHPNKPHKTRVAFDSGAEFNGIFINKELIPGPALENQLFGVLKRFRENKIAFMADIEKIYFQIFVAEECRYLLTFLWWRDGNILDKPIVYEMFVDVFRGVSSGACSNYALKRTAIENKDIYGNEASEIGTLRNNFYVNNLLKPVEHEDNAIHLIKKMRSMCFQGGFNSTNFYSNSKKVLLSILEERKKTCMKNEDLLGNLPEEQALDIFWKTKEDLLGLKVSIKDKSTTRRGNLSILSSVYDPLGFGAPFLLRGKQILQRLCEKTLKWVTKLPEDLQTEWKKWKIKLTALEQGQMKRYFMPLDFGKVSR